MNAYAIPTQHRCDRCFGEIINGKCNCGKYSNVETWPIPPIDQDKMIDPSHLITDKDFDAIIPQKKEYKKKDK